MLEVEAVWVTVIVVEGAEPVMIVVVAPMQRQALL